jgi:hypothetical protein
MMHNAIFAVLSIDCCLDGYYNEKSRRCYDRYFRKRKPILAAVDYLKKNSSIRLFLRVESYDTTK